MNAKSLFTIFSLIFALSFIGKPLEAIHQQNNLPSTTKQLKTKKSKLFKAKRLLKRSFRKSKNKDETIAKKIKRNANLALAFGVGAFATLFGAILIFQLPLLLLATAFLILMGIIFASKTTRQIKKVDENFFSERAKAKLGLIISLTTLAAPLLAALLALLYWW